MAARPSGSAQPVSLHHGVHCEVSPEVTVELVLVAVGELVVFIYIMSAARIYKAVVVFVLFENGIFFVLTTSFPN